MLDVTGCFDRIVVGILMYEKNSNISGCIHGGNLYWPVKISSLDWVKPSGPNMDASGSSREWVS